MKKTFLLLLVVASLLSVALVSPAMAQDGETTIWFGAGSTTLDPYYVPLFTLGRQILAEEGINMESLEADLINQALQQAGGNKSRAAKLLGLSRDAFLYRIKKHRITG